MGKKKSVQSSKGKKKATKKPEEQTTTKPKEFGGIPDVDLKKLLGCGG